MKRLFIGILIIFLVGFLWWLPKAQALPSELDIFFVEGSVPLPLTWLLASEQETELHKQLISTWREHQKVLRGRIELLRSSASSFYGKSPEQAIRRDVAVSLLRLREELNAASIGSTYAAWQRLTYTWSNTYITSEQQKELQEGIRIGYWLFQDVGDRNELYRVKQQLEEWAIRTASSPSDALAWRMLSLYSRLQESAWAADEQRLEEASTGASLGIQGLQNIAKDMGELHSVWKPEESEAFAQAWSRLQTQAALLKDHIARQESLAAAVRIEPPLVPVVTTTISVATSTPITTSTVEILTPTSSEKIIRVSIIPSTQSLSFGQSATLRTYAIFEDGAREDISNTCTFSVSPAGFGVLEKQRFSALANAGNAIISTKCVQDNQVFNGSVSLTVGF